MNGLGLDVRAQTVIDVAEGRPTIGPCVIPDNSSALQIVPALSTLSAIEAKMSKIVKL